MPDFDLSDNGGGLPHDTKEGKGRGIVEVVSEKIEENRIQPPPITVDYLEPNDFSRPGTELKKIKSVFVHYTANPGTSAAQNRSYFANLAETKERSASAHFIIGYEGELIQCIPLEEQAYAVATRNEDSVSIECCYLDEDGMFTQETYDTLIHTLAWLKQEYHLSADDRTDWFGADPVHGIRLSDCADAGLRCTGEDAFADIDFKPVLRHDDHHRRTLEDDDIEYELRVGRNDRRYAGNKSD